MYIYYTYGCMLFICPMLNMYYTYIIHILYTLGAEVKHTTNRKWVRLPGLNYDLQLWRPDTRKPTHSHTKSYDKCNVYWIKDIVDPWLMYAFEHTTLYLSSSDDLSSASSAVLMGYYEPPPKEGERGQEAEGGGVCMLREVVVYR